MPNKYSKNRPGSGVRNRGKNNISKNKTVNNSSVGTFSEDTSTNLNSNNNPDKFVGNNKNSTGSTNTKSGRKTPRRNKLHKKLGYPLARGPGEKTGDTFLIRCIEYLPPKGGQGMTLTASKKYGVVTDPNGGIYRGKEVKRGDRVETGYKNVGLKVTDANSRMSRNQKLLYAIELPIPQEINDSNVVSWGDNEMNIFQLAGVAAASELQKNPKESFQQALDFFQQGVELDGINVDTQNAIRNAISGQAINALGANVNVSQLISRSTGQVLNSNLELLFGGVNLRTFPFSVTFTPRYYDEMITVKRIIRQLKMSMAAKAGTMTGGTASGVFLKSPDVFSLRYLHNGQDHPFLNSFKMCALTGLNVNYTNTGTYASYADGTPVSIRMNMTFKELNPIYSEDYDEFTMSENKGVGY